MPISGSYNFPFVQTPNSSYPTMDLRILGASPGASSGLAKTFYSGSSLYTILGDGTLLNLGSSGSAAVPITGADTFSTNRITAPTEHLVLSSSAGSTIISSGSIFTDFGAGILNVAPLTANALSIPTIVMGRSGSALVAGMSFDATNNRLYTVVDGAPAFRWQVSGTFRLYSGSAVGNTTTIVANDTHLILRSAAGSQITVSGTLMVRSTNDPGDSLYITTTGSNTSFLDSFTGSLRTIACNSVRHSGSLINTAQHLILSSSVGSVITMSGTAKITQLPTSDPGIPGSLYRSGSFVLVSL